MYRGYILLRKTKTIKKRAIYVYLPSEGMAENWKKQAKKRKMSISKFVVHTVEATRGRLGDDNYRSQRDLQKELDELKEEKIEVDEQLRQKSMLVRSLDRDLRAARLDLADRITQKVPLGDLDFGRRLIAELQERRVATNDEILEALGIGFKDVESIEAVKAQLKILAEWDFITYTGNGWRWGKRQKKEP